MTQGDVGPVVEPQGAPAAPLRRRSILGKIGLAVSAAAWAVVGAILLLRPG